MGLDQYLYKVKKDISTEEYKNKLQKIIDKYEDWCAERDRDIDALIKEIGREDLGYWRKDYELDDYCTDLFFEKGGCGTFNCEYVELDKEDIENIIEQFKEDEYTEKIMKEALKAINEGYKIWYSNWW